MSEQKLAQLVLDFFKILDTKEVTDDGREFSPNYISSCRVMDGEKLGRILEEMKVIAGELNNL